MPRIAVVYHSGFGHTKVVAEHIAKGAESVGGMTVDNVPVADLPAPGADRSLGGKWSTLNNADGILFGAPTYMGSVAAEFKKFMEHSSGLWYQQAWKDKLAGGFTNSLNLSGDKLQTMQDLVVFAGQHSMVWVPPGIPARSGPNKDHNRLGSFLGVMTQSENESPEVTPPKGDRETAEAFGRRFAEAVARWTKGK